MKTTDALRARRRAMGLTLADVANRSGLSTSYVSKIERGKMKLSAMSLESIAKLSTALNFDAYTLGIGSWKEEIDPGISDLFTAGSDISVLFNPAGMTGHIQPAKTVRREILEALAEVGSGFLYIVGILQSFEEATGNEMSKDELKEKIASYGLNDYARPAILQALLEEEVYDIQIARYIRNQEALFNAELSNEKLREMVRSLAGLSSRQPS